MANTNVGTYSINDLLSVTGASALDFGMEKLYRSLQADLAFYNSQVNEQMGLLAEITTDAARKYGVSRTHRMTEIDEYGRASSKKATGSSDVYFPLRKYASAVAWTNDYMALASPAELSQEYLAIRAGHSYEVTQQIKKAIFGSSNYTINDPKTQVSLSVKRFLNGDGASIPDFEGASFDGSSHTHYLARASTLANSDIQGVIDTVTEHGHTSGLMICINKANKAVVSGLSDFTALASPVMVYNASDVTAQRMNNLDLNNQMIGFFNDIEVWVKPYIPANYILVVSVDGEKPLGFRQFSSPSLQGLRLVSNNPAYPLLSNEFEAWFGIGVNERSKGAVLYIGGTSWADASIS